MSAKHDSEWEIVEEIPGEKPPKNSKGGGLKAILKSKTLWIGLLVGAGLVIAIPVLRVMLQNAIRAWWLWLGLGLYFLWARLKKSNQAKR